MASHLWRSRRVAKSSNSFPKVALGAELRPSITSKSGGGWPFRGLVVGRLLADIRPTSTQIGRFRPTNFGRVWPKSDQPLTNIGRAWPNLGRFGPNSERNKKSRCTNVDQRSSILAQGCHYFPQWANFGQHRPILAGIGGRVWPHMVHIGPAMAQFGRIRAD